MGTGPRWAAAWLPPLLLLFALVLQAGGEESGAVPFLLRAAGKACGNAKEELPGAVGSAQDCADLACASPQCGAHFQLGPDLRCACVAPRQECDEVDDPASSHYEISETSACAHQASHQDADQPISDCFATLFETAFFTGWSASFSEGAHASEALAAAGAADKEASSIFVSGTGCFATVYQNADLSGWSATFSEGSYSGEEFVAAGAVDDDTSAIRVHFGQLPARASGGAGSEPQGRHPEQQQQQQQQRQQQQQQQQATQGSAGQAAAQAGAAPAAHEQHPHTLRERLAAAGEAAMSFVSHVGHRADSPSPPPPQRPRTPPPAPKRAPPTSAPTATRVSWETTCEPLSGAGCSEKEHKFIEHIRDAFGSDHKRLVGEAKRLKAKHAYFTGEQQTWIVQRVAILNRLASAAQRRSEL